MPVAPAASQPTAIPVHSFVQVLREHVRMLDTGSLWIEGEISNWSVPASGHAYFSLKDSQSQLRCVMFRGNLQRTPYKPRNGDAVLIQGDIDIYEARGEVQLIVRAFAPAGAGALQAQYEVLRQQLLAEGLFAAERKRPLPQMPHIIGVVTSATGAALQDVLSITSRRWPLASIRLTPCQVQGEGAVASIVMAIRRQNQCSQPADVLIIGRGGGSLEDLWAFNAESVVRAVASSQIPTVSAVGHETDTTLCDFAADVRAPTPSAAAELVTPDRREIADQVQSAVRYLAQSLSDTLTSLDQRLSFATTRLAHPQHLIESRMQHLDHLTQLWHNGMQRQLYQRESRANSVFAHLAALSPLQVLGRGYCLAQSTEGRTYTRAALLPIGQTFDLRFADGVTQVQRVQQGHT